MTDSTASQRMKRVRQKDTSAEIAVRRVLHALGANYRLNASDLPGSPDIVHRPSRRALFVNGCFWHHHALCSRGTFPKSNQQFWKKKFQQNRSRDQRKVDALREAGYRVMVVWECELEQEVALRERLQRFWFDEPTSQPDEPKRPLDLFDAKEERQSLEQHELEVDSWRLTRRISLRGGDSSLTALPPVELVTDGDYSAAFDLAWLRTSERPRYQDPSLGAPVRIADLFSGCGGMALGVMEAARAIGRSSEVAFAADYDAEALEVFENNLSPTEVEPHPIDEVLTEPLGADPTDQERALVDRIGSVDVLVGGPPCQGHSNLNNHTRRDDPKNELYARMARFAELFHPDHIIIENVSGVMYDKGGVFERTRKRLKELEYHVDHGVLHGEMLGVPQTRHRVFMIASKVRSTTLSACETNYEVRRRSFDWACRDLWVNAPNGPLSYTTEPKPITRDRIDYLYEHGLHDLPDDQRPDCHRLKRHSYVSVYGRIHGDLPAPTITTGFTVMGQGRFVHPYERRTLTPLEGARLQFFPDWFDFGERSRRAYLRMIGNAVPPKMVCVLATELLR
jgi:DNA (cytosine-5)-methyltransferase 1